MEIFRNYKTCGEPKTRADFRKQARMKDGYTLHCRQCASKKKQERLRERLDTDSEFREQHRSYFRDYCRLWRAQGKGSNGTLAAKYKWRNRNRKKANANARVSYALRKGWIVRKPCQVCGSTESQAHHPDYDHALEVIWLCPRHHKEEHRRMENLGV